LRGGSIGWRDGGHLNHEIVFTDHWEINGVSDAVVLNLFLIYV